MLRSAAFTPREGPWYSFYRGLSGPQDQSGQEGVKKNIHPSDTRDRTWAVQLRTLLLELPGPQLFYIEMIIIMNLWRYSPKEPRPTEVVAARGALWLAKRLSLNRNFSFLNQISLLLISSSYPIVHTMLGGPRSRPYTSRKIFRV